MERPPPTRYSLLTLARSRSRSPNPDQVRGQDASDAILAARKGEEGGADLTPTLTLALTRTRARTRTRTRTLALTLTLTRTRSLSRTLTPQEGGADAVRVLGDGCAHLHLRTPLPMRGVRILPLELHGGEHVWPEELR